MTSAIAIQPAPCVRPSTHCGVIDEAERRAADSGKRAADERVRIAVARDVDAHRVGGGGDSPTARTLRPGRVRVR